MNFELIDEIGKLLKNDKLNEAIQLTEAKLREQIKSDFNKLLGKNLLHQTDLLVEYFNNFYDKVKDNLNIQAIYGEMNDFTINCDMWFLNLFAYDKLGELDDTEWLADWEDENASKNRFVLTGYEELQEAYQDYQDNAKYKVKEILEASDITEILIMLRYQELIKATKLIAKQKNLSWRRIPVFASVHDCYDTVYKAD
ncbi:MAG: hypothetical protein NTW25_15250 [Candidatus Kapabacteria bacterium]|nr:hypothetical protein [Candidatus Kapabacteria bacterium]